jgi:Flp pilus assembly protein TadD
MHEPSEDTFKFRRGQYFWHTRTAIGQAAARAVAERLQVAEHILRRYRAPTNTQDNLAFPATVPSSGV